MEVCTYAYTHSLHNTRLASFTDLSSCVRILALVLEGREGGEGLFMVASSQTVLLLLLLNVAGLIYAHINMTGNTSSRPADDATTRGILETSGQGRRPHYVWTLVSAW